MSIETPRVTHLPGIQWSYYGGTGVDLFFVISGFIMVHVTRNTARGPAGAGHFLLRRISRIYPLYWLVSAALLAVYLYRPEFVSADKRDEP